MADWYDSLSSFLFSAGAGAISTAVVLLIFWAVTVIVRRRRERARPPHDFELDFTNMLILFQSMRDMLHQQKELARDINEMVDKKVLEVRRTLEQTLDEVNRLKASQRALIAQLEQARAESNVLRPPAGVREPEFPPFSLKDRDWLETHDTVPAPPADRDARPEPSALQVLPGERNPPNTDPTESWVGLDFGADQPDPMQFDVPDQVPEEPEDADAARNAFRALLDLQQPDAGVNLDAPRRVPVESGNGHGTLPALHARVYEYNDAGMSVPQISRELGMGKGEIRLILSLRKDKGV